MHIIDRCHGVPLLLTPGIQGRREKDLLMPLSMLGRAHDAA